jgi:intracellular septation protein
MTTKSPLNPALKLALELGPLLVFFIANAHWSIFIGTAAFMAAVLLALAVSYVLTRSVPVIALLSTVVVIVFGGLTLILHDAMFIKLKPTIIYTLFGTILLAGLAVGRPLLTIVFGEVFELTPEGWRKLTIRWALFFLAMAALNEIVWRTQSTDFWVTFKAFGVLPLTALFAALQVPLVTRHELPSTPGRKRGS